MRYDQEWVQTRLEVPERLDTLKATGLLDSVAEECFDRASRLATGLLKMPVALVSLVDDRRQFFKSQVGLSGHWAVDRQSPLSHSICQYVVANRETLVVGDARKAEFLRDNLGIEAFDIGSYVGIPLITSNDQAVGAFCAIDSRPHEFTDEQVKLLNELAYFVTNEIDLRLANRALHRSEGRMRAILEHAPVAIFVLRDRAGLIEAVNPKACALLGFDASVLEGAYLGQFVEKPNEEETTLLDRLWAGGVSELEREARLTRKDGQICWGRIYVSIVREENERDFAVAMIEDVTEAKEASELLEQQAAELKALSLTDPLTGLSNRRGFMAVGEQMLKVAMRQGEKLVLLFFDLDGLKKVNDQLGHEMGDAMIKQFSHILLETFRQSDLLGRIGGDEVVVLAHERPDGSGEEIMVGRLRKSMEALNAARRFPFFLAASAGAAYFDPANPKDMQALLSEADAAMYEDKRQRKAQRV